AARAERASLARGRYRFRLACLAFALAFALIAGRLVTLGFAATGPGAGGVFDISSTVHRPDVFDRSGRLLATDIKGATLFADPQPRHRCRRVRRADRERAARYRPRRLALAHQTGTALRPHQAGADAEAAGRDS